MTRFARARGSKSCNVKQPEEPTSWIQMKKAMEAKHSKEEDYTSARAALNSVKNRRDDHNKPTVWGPLENDDPSNALGFLRSQLEKRRKTKGSPDMKKEKKSFVNKSMELHDSKTQNNFSDRNSFSNFQNFQDDNEKASASGISESNDPSDALGFFKAQLEKRKKVKESPDMKKEKKSVNKSVDESLKKEKKKKAVGGTSPNKESEPAKKAVEKEEAINGVDVALSDKKKAKKQKLKESIEEKKDESMPTKKIKKGIDMSENLELKNGDSKMLLKKKAGKRKLKEAAVSKQENGIPENKIKKLEAESEIIQGEQKTVNNSFQKKKKREHKESVSTAEDANTTQTKKRKLNGKNEGKKNSPFKKSKKPQRTSVNRHERREKLKNLPPEQRRRKPEPETSVIFVNGESVKIQKFDGFYVTQEDAERLAKLKADMMTKGLPLKDVNGAIKLERRRAEKALARLKKKVCFHCRKSGHALSECPEIIDSHEKAMNVCYKCGSTEHTAYNCKVTHGSQFRFAECFICKEQGHIAKQCPDNPKGLYPKGGACNQCGDVTHLKKDCPQLIEKKEEMTITAGLRDDRMIEDLEEHLVEKKIKNVKSSVKNSKHVRF